MLSIITPVVWVVSGVGAVLLLGAAVGRLPARIAFVLIGIAELASLVGVLTDVVFLVRGGRAPEIVTHVSYLLTAPLIIPAGLALTYRKIDRWGLLILAVATLVAALMTIRQMQTLGIAYGYLNVRPAGG